MKSYEENKLLGGASCKNHIFLNAFALYRVPTNIFLKNARK
jgi:hypothetical protein